MAYTISITETLNTVTAVTTSNTIAVTVEDNVVNTTATNVTIDVVNQLNTVTVYTDAIELRIDDFANIFKGDWVSGTTYGRGELVNSTSSLYVSIVNTFTTFVSTVAPQNDPAKWTRVVWHEAPFAYINVNGTATVNSLVVGGGIGGNGLVINSTATFNGVANFNTVTNVVDLYINGLRFPPNKGVYGQVLYTNGVDQALWSDINDLLYWVLSSDLTTQGFNIVTGYDAAVPNPQLTIGSGVTGNLKANLKFEEGGNSAILSATNITLAGTTGISLSTNAGDLSLGGTTTTLSGTNIDLTGNVNITGATNITGSLTAPGANLTGGTTSLKNLTATDGSVEISRLALTGNNNYIGSSAGLRVYGAILGEERYVVEKYTNIVETRGYVRLVDSNPAGSGPSVRTGSGIIFNDGTIQTTAGGPTGPTGPQGPSGPSIFNYTGDWEGELVNQPPFGEFERPTRTYSQNDIVETYIEQDDGSGTNIQFVWIAKQSVPLSDDTLARPAGYPGWVVPGSDGGKYWLLQGQSGRNGYTGSFGYTGSAGPAGGYTGSRGENGYSGSKGDIGYAGSRGAQGNTGNTGSQGPQGPSGPAGGYTGSAGTPGPSGPAGGYTGSVGYTGSRGVSGSSTSTATTSAVGGVIIGDNVNITGAGVISIPSATTDTLGVVRAGTGVSVVNGVITVSTVSDRVSLQANMYTNGFYIGRDASGIDSSQRYISVDNDKLRLQASTSTVLSLSATTASIETSTLQIKTTSTTIIGSDIYNSRLRANEMTSFSGVGPVQFVHGIQFDDNTTQITAWQPDQLNIRVIDFGSI